MFAWTVLTALIGCERPESTPTPSATVAPAPTGLLIADAPVKTTTYAIGTEGESSYRIVVATGTTSCAALATAYPRRPKPTDGALIDFWAVKPLEKDGSRPRWTVRSAFIADAAGGRGLLTRGGTIAELRETADHVVIEGLELALQDHKLQGRLIQWYGPFEATRCKRVPRPEKPRPQPDLTLSIAGERLAVQGASIRSERGKRYLRLTRAAHACRSACAEGYDFYLDLALTGTPPKAAFVSLQGDMFPGAPAGSDGKEQFSVKLAPEFDSSGNAEASDAKASNAKARDAKARDATAVVEVQLDGSLTAQGYQVMLKGKASALHCGPITPSR